VADQVRPSSISGARVFSVLGPGHVGEERGRLTASSCRIGGDRGDQLVYELIQAGGIVASSILCRDGSGIATSDEEAIFESAMEARRCLATKWSHPWWLCDGGIHAGREPTSCSLSFPPGGCRRPVAETPLVLIASIQFVVECFL
jgi:hypothetical protein